VSPISRICKKWFLPNPQPGDRQKTCGTSECQRQWHIYGPDIVSRGIVFEDESQESLEDTCKVLAFVLEEINTEMRCDADEVKTAVRQTLRRFCKKTIKRRLVILPVIMEM